MLEIFPLFTANILEMQENKGGGGGGLTPMGGGPP